MTGHVITFLLQVAVCALGWRLLGIRWGEHRKFVGLILIILAGSLTVSFQ